MSGRHIGYRPKDTSSYVGKKFLVDGSIFYVAEFSTSPSTGLQRFICRAMDDRNKHHKRGEMFYMSKSSVYRYAKEGRML
jgi:hypothetical protein